MYNRVVIDIVKISLFKDRKNKVFFYEEDVMGFNLVNVLWCTDKEVQLNVTDTYKGQQVILLNSHKDGKGVKDV